MGLILPVADSGRGSLKKYINKVNIIIWKSSNRKKGYGAEEEEDSDLVSGISNTSKEIWKLLFKEICIQRRKSHNFYYIKGFNPTSSKP